MYVACNDNISKKYGEKYTNCELYNAVNFY